MRARAADLWRRLLDESARTLLAAHDVKLRATPDAATGWQLAVSSDVVPYLRYYKYWDRYPEGVLIDLLGQRVIDTPDQVAYQQLFLRSSPPPLDERTAGEYVKLFVALRAEPYAAENLAATAALGGESFVVTTTYERTTVWSPPHLPAIAGARTVRIVETWQVARDGALTAREKSEQELRTVPARN